MTHTIRAITDDEHGLLYSSYLKSSWPRNAQLSYSEHCTVSHERMRRCLRASNVVALCVVDDEAPGWVGGWLVGHTLDMGFALHYVYVKRDYRKLGLASMLLEATPTGANAELYVTHPYTMGIDGGARAREWLQGRLGAVHLPLSRVLAEDGGVECSQR